MKNIAIVNFQIENKKLIRIKRTQRVTFADTLSNIGMSNMNVTKTEYFLNMYILIKPQFFRWNIGAVLWNKLHQHDRTLVLDLSYIHELFQSLKFFGDMTTEKWNTPQIVYYLVKIYYLVYLVICHRG